MSTLVVEVLCVFPSIYDIKFVRSHERRPKLTSFKKSNTYIVANFLSSGALSCSYQTIWNSITTWLYNPPTNIQNILLENMTSEELQQPRHQSFNHQYIYGTSVFILFNWTQKT
jgi:hypothetical protein